MFQRDSQKHEYIISGLSSTSLFTINFPSFYSRKAESRTVAGVSDMKLNGTLPSTSQTL
jgi:hypothetical protein